MKNLAKYTFILVLLLSGHLINAQQTQEIVQQAKKQVEMADILRSEGKIYVVVLIILMVLGGLIAYLFLMDRKLNRLEKSLDKKQQTKP